MDEIVNLYCLHVIMFSSSITALSDFLQSSRFGLQTYTFSLLTNMCV